VGKGGQGYRGGAPPLAAFNGGRGATGPMASTAMVPSSMPSSSSDAIVKNEIDGVTYLGEPLLECTFAFGGSKRKQRGNWQLRRKLEKVADERCNRRRLVLSFACVCKHPRCRNVRVGIEWDGWEERTGRLLTSA
jgi:hypothetical protein